MTDQSSVFLLVTILVLVTILAIFAMRFFSSSRIERAAAARGADLQSLAERSADSQAETSTALIAIQADLADLRTRVIAIEALLKEVS